MNQNNNFDIDCTGDVCVGDFVQFERAIFSGSFRSPKFVCNKTIEGVVVADSYGKKTQQHTFTLEVCGGEKIRIKGRNLYRNGVRRIAWHDEALREKTLAEKHERGTVARQQKQRRLEGSL